MKKWEELEFEYAKRLRESSSDERKELYTEAYTEISKHAVERFTSTDPEKRTAGTSKRIVASLSYQITKNNHVLEIGAGRGYTCLKLAQYAKSIVGVEVAESSLVEAKELIAQNKIKNVLIKQVPANDLSKHFKNEEFDVAISIDVVEHLHPEDAKDHYKQIFEILKPKGKYIVKMPNRLTGPHDITRTVFPESKEPLGFHLNESTYKETIKILRLIGFKKFYALFRRVKIPVWIIIVTERLYKILPKKYFRMIFTSVLSIRLIAKKV